VTTGITEIIETHEIAALYLLVVAAVTSSLATALTIRQINVHSRAVTFVAFIWFSNGRTKAAAAERAIRVVTGAMTVVTST
jgi:hypothetical protein